mmetsp:Transcript_15112/g.48202  ORF Transcript_15112/g.48202 Transcript_15112/m.48202 type:complete len:207 (+) Transcript_15112:783-1403(+)
MTPQAGSGASTPRASPPNTVSRHWRSTGSSASPFLAPAAPSSARRRLEDARALSRAMAAEQDSTTTCSGLKRPASTGSAYRTRGAASVARAQAQRVARMAARCPTAPPTRNRPNRGNPWHKNSINTTRTTRGPADLRHSAPSAPAKAAQASATGSSCSAEAAAAAPWTGPQTAIASKDRTKHAERRAASARSTTSSACATRAALGW